MKDLSKPKNTKLKELNDLMRFDTAYIAFRKIYLDLFLNGDLKVIFRPGIRACGDPKGYCVGDKPKVRIIDQLGADWADIPPTFIDKDFGKILIKKVETKKIKDFTDADFVDSTPDIKNIESLKFHLGLVYNMPVGELTNDNYVTRIEIEKIAE
jgi:hypothetical protein